MKQVYKKECVLVNECEWVWVRGVDACVRELSSD